MRVCVYFDSFSNRVDEDGDDYDGIRHHSVLCFSVCAFISHERIEVSVLIPLLH